MGREGGKISSGYRIWGKVDAGLYDEEGMNGLLVENEILCMQCPLMNRKTMILPVGPPIPSS
jgi:hypothetical protein